jgi:hypothetical protein
MPPDTPPKPTTRPRVIRDIGQAVAIQSGLGEMDKAIRALKRAGLSWGEIHTAFWNAMRDSWDEATQ